MANYYKITDINFPLGRILNGSMLVSYAKKNLKISHNNNNDLNIKSNDITNQTNAFSYLKNIGIIVEREQQYRKNK